MKYTKIIISGLRCTGKTTLFWGLQKKLNWPTLSVSEFLRDYVGINGLSHQNEKIDLCSQDISSEIDKRVSRLLQSYKPVIISTRVFGQIDQQFDKTFKILLRCDNQVRAERYAFRENTTIIKAKQRLFKKEQDWYEKIKTLYNRTDLFDPKYYDLVIDTTKLTKQHIQGIVLTRLFASEEQKKKVQKKPAFNAKQANQLDPAIVAARRSPELLLKKEEELANISLETKTESELPVKSESKLVINPLISPREVVTLPKITKNQEVTLKASKE